MDSFIIKGPTKLSGSINTDGSKNAALPILAATLLIAKGETTINNVPPLRDIYTIVEMLRYVGAVVTYSAEEQSITVDATNINESTAPYELMRKMRASFLVLGPLLARLGEAKISLPGGCSLGARPVDYHIRGFSKLGADIKEEAGYVIASGKPLKGNKVIFDRPSHTGTENIIFGAVFAKGTTTIINAACDPEIVDVVQFLNKAGAKISGAGTPHIVIEPVQALNAIGYSVSGDRLVAGTYLIAAAITGSEIEVKGVPANQLEIVIEKLQMMGCKFGINNDQIKIKSPEKLNPVSMTTFPYPGFPTDLQACLVAASTIASGTSHIRETVFTDRFNHTMELRRLGAEITVSSDEAIITGVGKLTAAQVMAPDIRAGAGIVLACLAAQGESEILRIYHIDRGYDRLENKLSLLGADILRKSS